MGQEVGGERLVWGELDLGLDGALGVVGGGVLILWCNFECRLGFGLGDRLDLGHGGGQVLTLMLVVVIGDAARS